MAKRLTEGSYTTTVYSLIHSNKYDEAIPLLTRELQNFPLNRAALSLLGYCYYTTQNYTGAAQCYEQLVRNYPDVSEYKVYHCQSLHKAGLYADASRAASLIVTNVSDIELQSRILKLQLVIKYELDDNVGARALLEQCLPDDPDAIMVHGAILYKEEKYTAALKKFTEAQQLAGYQPFIAYNLALCNYRLKQHQQARKHVVEVMDRGFKEHPELGIGTSGNFDDVEARSVGNTRTLSETALIEAFNLKAAIEYDLKNFDTAKEALHDMPPRTESELDPVTLHNLALMHMDDSPQDGFPKLNFLLSSSATNGPNVMPAETLGNLLLLYCRYGFYDAAADVLAENQELLQNSSRNILDPELHSFLDALILQQSAPEEAFRRFDDIAKKHIEVLRKLTKSVQDAKNSRDEEATRAAVKAYDEQLEKYIPVLMAQAKIYWDMGNYPVVEKLFRQSLDFCIEHETWRLNVAHVLFMQDGNPKDLKFKDAIKYYEPIVRKNQDQLLSVTAIVLANLCVSYIMTSQNEVAEELMRRIEKEEERVQYQDPEKRVYHLCIINLVIGTLYCAKGNYEFGISRVIKSLEPYPKKLDPDTWFYAKRCFLALAEGLAKHIVVFNDKSFSEVLAFLDAADLHGRTIPASTPPPILPDGSTPLPPNTISYEARHLKRIFFQLKEW